MSRARLDPAGGRNGELTQALACTRRDLPPGPVLERLRNYCGRVWEVICTPAFVDAFRRSLDPGRAREGTAREVPHLIAGIVADIDRLLVEGAASGELRPRPRGPVARLLVSSMLIRAHWCTHSDSVDVRVAGTSTRVVAETLDLVLPSIGAAAAPPEAASLGTPGDGGAQ